MLFGCQLFPRLDLVLVRFDPEIIKLGGDGTLEHSNCPHHISIFCSNGNAVIETAQFVECTLIVAADPGIANLNVVVLLKCIQKGMQSKQPKAFRALGSIKRGRSHRTIP